MSKSTAGRQRFERPAHPQRPKRPQGDQSALLVAATRRSPAVLCVPSTAKEAVTMPVRTAAPQPLPPIDDNAPEIEFDDARTRVINFADLPAEDPELFAAAVVAASPLRPGHEHANTVIGKLRIETAPLKPRGTDEHVTHHQLPAGFELRTVPMPETDAELCDSVELAIARFAIAASDLALLPGGVHALVMLMAAHTNRPVSTYDRRPLGAPVGRELSGVAA